MHVPGDDLYLRVHVCYMQVMHMSRKHIMWIGLIGAAKEIQCSICNVGRTKGFKA